MIRISEIMTDLVLGLGSWERKKDEKNMKSRNYIIVERKRAVKPRQPRSSVATSEECGIGHCV